MAAGRGVIFDFFGTLTLGVGVDERDAGAARLAEALGVEPAPFTAVLTATFYERATGRWGDLASTLREVARRCGVEPSAAQLDEACRVRVANETGFLRLRPEAPAVVEELRRDGLVLGLISDCTHELPDQWSGLPLAPHFAAATFSVTAGRHKPDPSLYAETAAGMGVDPSRCLYVGDGGSEELTGAAEAGMTPVLLHAPDSEGALVYRRQQDWAGAVVHSLAEVPALVRAWAP